MAIKGNAGWPFRSAWFSSTSVGAFRLLRKRPGQDPVVPTVFGHFWWPALAPPQWTFVGQSTGTATASNITMGSIADTAQNDLMVVWAAVRNGEVPTLSGDWTSLVSTPNASDNVTPGQSQVFTWYCVRGASDPNLGLTRGAGADVLRWGMMAFRASSGYTIEIADTNASADAGSTSAMSVDGWTTSEANSLLIGIHSQGRNSVMGTHRAETSPTQASGTANDTITALSQLPTNQWLRVAGGNTSTGFDLNASCGIAVKSAAGATGNILATGGQPAPPANISIYLRQVPSSGLHTGTVSATEDADTLAATGALRIAGTLAVTEADDTLAATGSSVESRSGSLAVTEADDTVAATGALRIAGSLAVTEAADTVAATGALRIAGSLSATEADDTLAATGALRIAGSLSVTEEDDTLAATGSSVESRSGSLAVTEADDTVSATGALRIAGTLAVTEADDTVSATGTLPIVGSLAATEAADTVAATGALRIAGTLAGTEADDTVAATGALRIAGTLADTEAADTVAATGALRIAGSLSVTEAADTIAASGTSAGAGRTATLAVTEADDTVASTAGRAWTPDDLTVKAVIWYDAAAPQTITQAGGTVSQLDDRGLSGYSLTQAAGTRQPAYSATGFNGRPGITFDGTSDVLARAATPSTGLFGAGGTTGNLFIVGRYISGVVWFKWQSTTTNRFGLEGAARWDYPNGTVGSGQFTTFTGFSGSENAIFFYNADGATRRVYKNSTVDVSTGSIPAGIASASGSLSIGADATNTNFSNFVFAEAVLLPYAPTEDERFLIEGYLAHKWGLEANLPSNHPYRFDVPMAVPPPADIEGNVSGQIGDGIEAIAEVNIRTGDLVVTEASDTLASTGALRIAGALAVTEAADTVVSTGALRIAGTLAVTEAADTVASAGTLRIAGALAVTEAADTVASTGALRIVGTLAATEADDTLVSTGVLPSTGSGSLAVTEAADTLAAAGTLPIVGSLAVAEASDTVQASGMLRIAGSLIATEVDDTVAATGALRITGAVGVIGSPTFDATSITFDSTVFTMDGRRPAVTNEDDTVTATGALRVAGSLAVTEAADTLSASGTLPITGSLSVAGATDTLVASGALVGVATGSLIVTEAGDTLTATGTLPIGGSLAVTEGDDTLAAVGSLRIAATLAANENNDTLAATGTLVNVSFGSLSVTEASDTLAAAGSLRIAGVLIVTEADDTLAARNFPDQSGSLNVAEANDNLAATGTLTAIPIRRPGRSGNRPASASGDARATSAPSAKRPAALSALRRPKVVQ